jgi:predicted  nucleic acid-binding Zn-ribbon protein
LTTKKIRLEQEIEEKTTRLDGIKSDKTRIETEMNDYQEKIAALE